MVRGSIKAATAAGFIWLLIPAITLAWTIFPNLGDERAGTASMQFLKLGAGARAAAMGNSVASDVDGGFGLYWNPATLVWGQNKEVALSHNFWVNDISYDFAGISVKLGDDRALGASVIYLGTPDMNVTDEYHPYGTGEKFGFADFAFGLSFCQRLTEYFSFGATGKYAQEGLENLRMKGFLLDLGTYYQTNFHGTRFAVTLSNFGQQVKPGGSYVYTNPTGERIPKSYQSFSPPTIFRIAMATDVINHDNSRLQTCIQLDHPTDNSESFSFGTEYGLNKSLFLRFGYKDLFRIGSDTRNIQSYSLGFGINARLFSTDCGIDYAFSSLGDLGKSNTFSFQWSF
jgi:hypothetical protein